MLKAKIQIINSLISGKMIIDIISEKKDWNPFIIKKNNTCQRFRKITAVNKATIFLTGGLTGHSYSNIILEQYATLLNIQENAKVINHFKEVYLYN